MSKLALYIFKTQNVCLPLVSWLTHLLVRQKVTGLIPAGEDTNRLW